MFKCELNQLLNARCNDKEVGDYFSSGFASLQGQDIFLFSETSRLDPTQPPCSVGTGVPSAG